MLKSLKNYEPNDMWDKIQPKLKCCGVNNATDWSHFAGSFSDYVPNSCCKKEYVCKNDTEISREMVFEKGKWKVFFDLASRL